MLLSGVSKHHCLEVTNEPNIGSNSQVVLGAPLFADKSLSFQICFIIPYHILSLCPCLLHTVNIPIMAHRHILMSLFYTPEFHMELMATAQTPSVDATSSEVPSTGSSPFSYDIVILGVYTVEVCTPKSLRLVKLVIYSD